MQLSLYTDYTIRIMIYLGVHRGRLCSINEIAICYGISRNHLMKIVHQLGKAGFIITVRGCRGGLRLNKEPNEITLGSIIRYTEQHEQPIKFNNCIMQSTCNVTEIIIEAFEAFYGVLETYTLESILRQPLQFKPLLYAIPLPPCTATP